MASPPSATAEPSVVETVKEPVSSDQPLAEASFEPPAESSETFAVTKPEIRDRMFDWDNEIAPSFDAYDAATTSSALKSAARDILSVSTIQERSFVENTAFDPRYKVPISMWRDAVSLMSSGATNVVRGVDRGDPALIRKGKRAIKAGRDLVSSTEFLGEWGPLVIH